MEDDQNLQQQQQVSESSQPQVGPIGPVTVKPKSKGGVKTFLGIFILIIFIVGGFLIFKDRNSQEEEEIFVSEEESYLEETPTPTSTPEPVDKEEIVISIENGTGTAGEAAYLRDILKSAGYSEMTVGNSETTDNVTTSVTFSADLDEASREEITTKLKTIYKEVSVSESSTQKEDVVIVTGERKGATAKPSSTPTVSPKPTVSSTPTSSPSATPLQTP